MIPHDILTLYDAKALEYVIALLFLAFFVPFWQYVSGDVRPALQPAAHAAKRKPARPFTELVEWFRMAPDAFYHPGHSWARAASDGRVALGVDDFNEENGSFMYGSCSVRPDGTRCVGRGDSAALSKWPEPGI